MIMPKTITIDKAVMMEEIRILISEGKTVTITVKGNSMNPFLVDRRDTITLGGFHDEEIRRGCVALVRDLSGDYLIHRVIRRDGDIITLKGDGNSKKVETAKVGDVIAIMTGMERKGRTYTTDDLVWKIYSGLWMFLSPIRRLPLGLWRRFFLKC